MFTCAGFLFTLWEWLTCDLVGGILEGEFSNPPRVATIHTAVLLSSTGVASARALTFWLLLGLFLDLHLSFSASINTGMSGWVFFLSVGVGVDTQSVVLSHSLEPFLPSTGTVELPSQLGCPLIKKGRVFLQWLWNCHVWPFGWKQWKHVRGEAQHVLRTLEGWTVAAPPGLGLSFSLGWWATDEVDQSSWKAV